MKGLALIQHEARGRLRAAMHEGERDLRERLAQMLHQLADEVITTMPLPRVRTVAETISSAPWMRTQEEEPTDGHQ